MFSLKWLSHLRITFLCRFRMAGAGRSDFTPSEIKILQKPSPREIWSANSLLHMQDSSRKGFQWKESRRVTFVLVAYPSWVSGYPGIHSQHHLLYYVYFASIQSIPWGNLSTQWHFTAWPASQSLRTRLGRLFYRYLYYSRQMRKK